MVQIIQQPTGRTRAKLIREEKELLERYKVTNKVVERGLAGMFEYMYSRVFAKRTLYPEVIILNPATASAIRRRFGDWPGVRMVITNVAETGLVYQVTDENLRVQLLSCMAERW